MTSQFFFGLPFQTSLARSSKDTLINHCLISYIISRSGQPASFSQQSVTVELATVAWGN